MSTLWKIILKGLSAVLPLGLTVSLIYWVGVSTELVMGKALKWVLPAEYYWPGMGLLAGVAVLIAIGLSVNAWVVRKLLEITEHLLERIPLVKSVYGAIRDFLNYFNMAEERQDLESVVLVSLGDGEAELLGFMTQNPASIPARFDGEEDRVAVYLPMSYQIGGFTLYLPRSQIRSIDMSVEDAMRTILTAGLSGSRERNGGR